MNTTERATEKAREILRLVENCEVCNGTGSMTQVSTTKYMSNSIMPAAEKVLCPSCIASVSPEVMQEILREFLSATENARADRRRLNHIEALLQDYVDDSGTSHRVVRAIANVMGFDLEADHD